MDIANVRTRGYLPGRSTAYDTINVHVPSVVLIRSLDGGIGAAGTSIFAMKCSSDNVPIAQWWYVICQRCWRCPER